MTDTITLVPPLRLGVLLAEARTATGSSQQDLAARSGHFTPAELDDAERGRLRLDETTITALIRTYGLDPGALVPERSALVIDLEEGRLAIADDVAQVDDPSSADDVLARYLGLVYAIRDIPVGSFVELRDLDLDVLGTALQLRQAEVEARLRTLIADADPAVSRAASVFRRRLLVPVAGVLLGATAVGALLLVQRGNDSAPTEAPAVEIGVTVTAPPETVGADDSPDATVPGVELAPAVAVERDPSSTVDSGDTENPFPNPSPGGFVVDTDDGPVELIEPLVVERD